MHNASQHTQTLLKCVRQYIDRLNYDIEKLRKQPNSAQPQRFDNKLFHSVINSPKEYLAEIEKNFAALQQNADHDNIEQTAFLAEKLIAQITALQRELATQTLRENELKRVNRIDASNNYQKLSQYQDYRRRLKQMIRDKEECLQSTNAIVEQQSLQRDIAVLEGRYARCCQAIKVLEYHIERQEKAR